MKQRLFFLFTYLFVLFGIISPELYAQSGAEEDDAEPSELHLFRGGYMDVSFGLNLNTIGGSLGSSGMGGLLSSKVYNGALNVNLNPAMLAFNTSGHMVFDSRIGLGTDMNAGLNKRIINSLNTSFDSSITDTFSDTDTWTQFPETYIQPTKMRNLDVGLTPNIGLMAFSMPITEELTLAASYNYPMSMDLDMGLTGISAKLAQEQMQKMRTMIDHRFGVGTWQSIVDLRAKRIQEAREEALRIRKEKAKKAKELQDALLQALIFIVIVGTMVGAFTYVLIS